MLDLGHILTGSDLDINDLSDVSDSDIFDLDDDSVAMEEPINGTVCQPRHNKQRRHPEPMAREWLETPDMENDKPPTLLDYGEIGGHTKDMAAEATAVDYFDLYILFLANDGTYWFWRPTDTRKGKQQMLL